MSVDSSVHIHGGLQSKTIQSFLTPESMLTPGAAGTLTMTITNVLALSFNSPRALTGIVISFVFGLLVLVSERIWWEKLVYYLLNSLIIFCMAVGANGIAIATAPAPPEKSQTSFLSFSAWAVESRANKQEKSEEARFYEEQKRLFMRGRILDEQLLAALERKANGESVDTEIVQLVIEKKRIEEEMQQRAKEWFDQRHASHQRAFFAPWFLSGEACYASGAAEVPKGPASPTAPLPEKQPLG